MSVGDTARTYKRVEPGHCPICAAYIGCKADHDTNCERYEATDNE